MISPSLVWSRAQLQKPQPDEDVATRLAQWLPGLMVHSRLNGGSPSSSPAEEMGDRDGLLIHAAHRRSLYLGCARHLSQFSDAHDYYRLMMWCHDQGIFIHPAVCVQRRPSLYRDHAFTVSQNIERLTPLLAIPESLIIGFKNLSDTSDSDNSLRDEKREKEFNELNSGDGSDSDVCQFFFASLSMVVSDLVTAKSSPLTDPRWAFAELLGKVRTLKNAPYLEDDVVLDAESSGLADVLLQMIRNYINGGPLVGKVDRTELRWAVSVCLSHSTPLAIAATRSIGIIPMVHLFPHGGKETNAFLVSRTSRPHSAEKIAAYFSTHHGYDFAHAREGKWIYVVPSRPLLAGEEIHLQAMAPVCGRDSEAEKMWRLSCAAAPKEYMTSAAVAQMQQRLTCELIEKGDDILSGRMS
ncbi:putative trans-sialidase [Trypanosoma grayi]|uniref:putative trans-sialidase n=1 Tax=Trypanosoma grayi TaxID=71804 RepID=UPI0004F40147|nr:putative trans-sialidase [Trypanosoma grayi]KEG12284.1 putative trans-sialidase [Trypanosoma grayi]